MAALAVMMLGSIWWATPNPAPHSPSQSLVNNDQSTEDPFLVEIEDGDHTFFLKIGGGLKDKPEISLTIVQPEPISLDDYKLSNYGNGSDNPTKPPKPANYRVKVRKD